VFKVRSVLRHQPLEKFLQIAPRRRIRVFHDNEAAARVPYEYGDGSGNHPLSRMADSTLSVISYVPLPRVETEKFAE
jgi:hypothetical protein